MLAKMKVLHLKIRMKGITDKPDSSSSYEDLDDMLLAYASYWHAMDKKTKL